MTKLFFTAAALLLAVSNTLACDQCGNFMGLTPYDNVSQVTLLHRYRMFNGYRTYQQHSAFFVPGAYKTTHNPGVAGGDSVVETTTHSARDYESYKVLELRGKYFLGRRLEINAIVPLQQVKTRYDGATNCNTGLADPSFFAGWHVLRRLDDTRLRQRLIVGAGVKIPVGNYRKADAAARRFFLLNQNGTGSWDHFYYVNYLLRGRRLGANVNSLIKFNGSNAFGERVGNSLNQSVSVFAEFSLRQLKLYPALLSSYEYCKGVYTGGDLLPATGMNLLMAGPSVDVMWRSLVINATFQFNARERVSSQSLAAAGRFVVGITWNFAQVRYLINS